MFVIRPAIPILVSVVSLGVWYGSAVNPEIRPCHLAESHPRWPYGRAPRYTLASQVAANNSAEALQQIAVEFQKGNKAGALQRAAEGIEHDSQGSLTPQIGLLLLENGCYAEAATAFKKALSRTPDSIELASKLAYAYLGDTQPDPAIRLLSHFPGRHSSWQASLLLGQAYELAGMPQEAIGSFQDALRLRPDEASIHYELGRLLIISSDPRTQAKGAQEMQKAIRLNPSETDYYLDLGTWLLNQGDLKSAVDLLTFGVKYTQPSDKLYLMLGMAEYWLYEGAGPTVSTLDKVIDLNPHAAPAYNILGYCSLFGGDYKQALQYFQKAIDENPQNGLYDYGVARALESLNRIDEALSFAEEAVRIMPHSSRNHYLLGKIYAKLGRNNEAVSQLETAVGLDPENASPYYQLVQVYVRMNNPDRAQQWSQKLQELTLKKRQTERGNFERRGTTSSVSSDLPQPPEIWNELRDSQPNTTPEPR